MAMAPRWRRLTEDFKPYLETKRKSFIFIIIMSAPPPVAKRNANNVFAVRAVYAYKATRPDELSFSEGDILYVLDKTIEKDWWKCRCNGKEGMVPANYVGENTETIDNPVHEAAKRGNIGFLKELLDAGMSVNTLDTAGNSPLHWAARGGHDECIKMLLAKKPVLNVQNKLGDTPLHSAAWGGRPASVRLLVEAGVDRTILNNDGKTAYALAKTTEAAAELQVIVGEVAESGDPDSD